MADFTLEIESVRKTTHLLIRYIGEEAAAQTKINLANGRDIIGGSPKPPQRA